MYLLISIAVSAISEQVTLPTNYDVGRYVYILFTRYVPVHFYSHNFVCT